MVKGGGSAENGSHSDDQATFPKFLSESVGLATLAQVVVVCGPASGASSEYGGAYVTVADGFGRDVAYSRSAYAGQENLVEDRMSEDEFVAVVVASTQHARVNRVENVRKAF